MISRKRNRNDYSYNSFDRQNPIKNDIFIISNIKKRFCRNCKYELRGPKHYLFCEYCWRNKKFEESDETMASSYFGLENHKEYENNYDKRENKKYYENINAPINIDLDRDVYNKCVVCDISFIIKKEDQTWKKKCYECYLVTLCKFKEEDFLFFKDIFHIGGNANEDDNELIKRLKLLEKLQEKKEYYKLSTKYYVKMAEVDEYIVDFLYKAKRCRYFNEEIKKYIKNIKYNLI